MSTSHDAPARVRLAVVVLHHRGWDDTRACLETLARQGGADAMQVILVDNSGDADAVGRAQAWIAGGDGAAVVPPGHEPTRAASLVAVRGVPSERWTVLDEGDVPPGVTAAADATRPLARWTLVRAVNRGFGAGMNVGLRLALADPAVVATWLLNNDTWVDARAVCGILAAVARDADVGQWGTQVRWWNRPEVLQSDGGCEWFAWTARGRRTGDGVPIGAAGAGLATPRRIPWPGHCYGASWVLRNDAVRDVGLLSEAAIVYGEELDWTGRARGRWAAATIPGSVVWHREGATAGAGAAGPKSAFADLQGVAARLRITRRFFAAARPTVYLTVAAAAVWRAVVRRQPDRARAILRLLHAGDAALVVPPAGRPSAPLP